MDGMSVSSEEILFKRKEEEGEVGLKERSRGALGRNLQETGRSAAYQKQGPGQSLLCSRYCAGCTIYSSHWHDIGLKELTNLG